MITLSIDEIAKAIAVSKRAAERRALRESWPYSEETCRGGRRRRYALADLPVDVRQAVERHLIARQVVALQGGGEALSHNPFAAARGGMAASSGESIGGARSSPDTSCAAPASADGGLAGGSGAGRAFAPGGDVAAPAGHLMAAAPTGAADAGNGMLTRGAGSNPAAPATLTKATLTPGPSPGGRGGSFALTHAPSPGGGGEDGALTPGRGVGEAPWHAAMDALAGRPKRVREEAMRRARACLIVKRLVDAGLSARQAIPQAAAEAGVPAGTLSRWWFGHGLLPGVSGQPVAAWPALLAPRWGVQDQREAELSGPAWDAILKAYLRPEKPSLMKCYRDVAAHAAARGWRLPSYASVARRVKRLDPRLVTLAREGKKAFEAMFPPLKRSVAHLSALEWVNADGHKLDLLVRLPERFGGGIGRVHLIAWQDVYSRKILAWRLTPTLNAYSVLLSFGDLVERYGLPKHALFDNGREFGAKLITGGTPWRFRFKAQADEMLGALPLLGVEVHWATPFHGQAKPIERGFRDLAEEIAKDARLAGAHTGNRPEAKPENYGSRAAEWALVEQVVNEAIARHNAREGRRTETARGRSFDAVFAESYARQVVTKLAPSQRAMLLLAAEPVKVRPDNLVVVCGNAYMCEPGWGVAGQRVVARFDPDDLRKPIAIHTLDGRLVGFAEPAAAPFDDQAAAQAVQRYRAAARRAARERLKYLEKVEALTAPAVEAAGAVEPAAARLFAGAALTPGPSPQGRGEEEARLSEMVARTDALILEMARRLAG